MKKVGSDSTVFSSLDKIQNLLQEGILNESTKLVLVNAIYFKGSWQKKFKDTETKDTQFNLNQVRPQIEFVLFSFYLFCMNLLLIPSISFWCCPPE